MTSTANYRIHEKKCATCSYWAGTREIVMQSYQPFYKELDSPVKPEDDD